ncbi:MAG: hypothetical protein JWM11_4522 [Planctomycetaceae bacterium]|nr:hypothetical protein [Planctomycetaceae bacterium]
MIYLASPYSHPDSAVRDFRYDQACRAVAHLLRNNCVAFSPVMHSHPLVAFGVPSDWSFWQQIDRAHLLRSGRRGAPARQDTPWGREGWSFPDRTIVVGRRHVGGLGGVEAG